MATALPSIPPPIGSKQQHEGPRHLLFHMKLKLVSQLIDECNYSYKYQEFPAVAHINTQVQKTVTVTPEVGLIV